MAGVPDVRIVPAGPRQDLIIGRPGYGELTEELLSPIGRGGLWWWILFALATIGVVILALSLLQTLGVGVGVFGNDIPNAWAFPIISYVWWIGIGFAGTFISTVLLLMGERWRGSINRVAETMTIFALLLGGLYPIVHLGRPWFAYWVMPYPATMGTWPEFKSPLTWDVAGIAVYLFISSLMWYLGLVPDLATIRDRPGSLRRRRLYGILALGWRGSAREWRQYRTAYVLLAALAMPVGIAMHSILSLDFAVAILPGWHSTLFPPYFVVGAVFSGFAMVTVLTILVRHAYGLKNVLTPRHLENLAKLTLATSWMMLFSYVAESFTAWYSADQYERYMYLVFRPLGAYAWVFWGMILCNVLLPQLFWSRRLRRNEAVLFFVGLAVLCGMWIERFEIIVTAESRDFLPSSWHLFSPSLIDWGILGGAVGFFLFGYLLVLRYAPIVPLNEVKRLRRELEEASAGESHG